MRRTVITGLGAVTPVGNDMRLTWDALIAGKSGVGRIERFDPDAAGLKFPLAAEVRDFSPEDVLPDAKTLPAHGPQRAVRPVPPRSRRCRIPGWRSMKTIAIASA